MEDADGKKQDTEPELRSQEQEPEQVPHHRQVLHWPVRPEHRKTDDWGDKLD